MQLLIVNQDHHGYLRGDIVAVKPDTHFWSALEVASIWLASDSVAIERGLPPEYQEPYQRTTANFPNPFFAVVRYPSYRCDLNFADAMLANDPDEVDATMVVGKRGWYLDLDALPAGQRNSLEQPGGEATLGANRLNAIKSRVDGTPITDSADWTGDTSQGNTPHRHPFTDPRLRLAVP